MKSKLIYIIFGAILSLGSFSCKKYLDKKSNNSLVVPSSLSDLQGLLDDGSSMNQQVTPSFGEASADDYFLLLANYNTRTSREQAVYKWIPFDYNFQDCWSKNYFPIYNSNYCLDMVAKITLDASNKVSYNNVKGSALFYRAYYFSQLTWTFAKAYDESTSGSDLGIALRLNSDFNVQSVRASVMDCYNRITNDAKDAAALLPDLSTHSFRPSKCAAYGLLARVYLAMRNYDSAFKYSNLALMLKSNLLDYKSNINPAASLPFPQFNAETIFYSEMNTLISLVSPTFAKIDTLLYASYASNDIRRKAFFSANSGYQKFKGSYTGNVFLFTGIANDELFLIRAECNARGGDKIAALTDLNSLLAKRYDATFTPVTAVDANDALSKILIERRKELLMRGLRFIDIKRLNKENANITPRRIVNGQQFIIAPNDNHYALPLPLDIISLSGMPQNPY